MHLLVRQRFQRRNPFRIDSVLNSIDEKVSELVVVKPAVGADEVDEVGGVEGGC